MLAGRGHCEHKWEAGQLLHSRGKVGYAFTAGDPVEHLSVLSYPVIKVSGQLQLPHAGRSTTDPNPTEMKI